MVSHPILVHTSRCVIQDPRPKFHPTTTRLSTTLDTRKKYSQHYFAILNHSSSYIYCSIESELQPARYIIRVGCNLLIYPRPYGHGSLIKLSRRRSNYNWSHDLGWTRSAHGKKIVTLRVHGEIIEPVLFEFMKHIIVCYGVYFVTR